MEELNKLTPFEKMVLRRIIKLEKELYHQSLGVEWSKKWQQRVDNLIPQKVHHSLAFALEKGVKSFLQGLHLLDFKSSSMGGEERKTLEERTEEALKIVQRYKKIAMVEGAGTGFGGLISSAIDFPLLISIKLKLLQELAFLFGYRLRDFEERLYILKIFQLQFSSKKFKQETWTELKEWNDNRAACFPSSWAEFDWDTFYMEYKQSIELRKLFQILPGFGALVGAWANRSFIDDLGRTAILCFQWRKIQEK